MRKTPSESEIEAVVQLFASRSHNAWRRQFHKDRPREKLRPRMRLRGGVMVDINRPWSRLDVKAQKDNLIAARAAYKAVVRHPADREAAAAYVHARWITRNKRDPNQPKALFRPYPDLPEIEKDKDRAHVDRIKAAIAAVSRKAKQKRRAKRTKAKTRKVRSPSKRARRS